MPAAPSCSTLDFLAATYRLQDLDSLANTILLELPRIIPCDNVMIGSHDGTRRVMTGIVLRTPFTHSQFLAEANQTGLMGLHPFWDRMLDSNQPLKVLSEMSPGRRWLENPIYHEVLREDRVRDHLNVEFGSSISNFTSVSVIRSTVGFRNSERETLQLLLPHLAQAFSNAQLIDRSGIATSGAGSWIVSAMSCTSSRRRDSSPRVRRRWKPAIGLPSEPPTPCSRYRWCRRVPFRFPSRCSSSSSRKKTASAPPI